MSTDTQPPQPTSSAADDLPAEPPLLTADVCGFYLPGRVDEIEARWAQMVDLPLEEESRDFSLASTSTTSVTDVERDALPKLKEAILKQMGLDAVPPGFQAHHFTQWKLLCMLRARNGDVEKATARALECIASVDHVMAYARQFEAAPARLRALYQQYHPSGMFGVDKRGCPVIYGRLGRTDLAGLVREAGIGFHRQQEFYHNLLTWDVTYMQSVRRGVALQGSLFVMDVSGLTLSGGYASYKAAKHMMEDGHIFPGGEHPMPEGMRKCIVCNAPRWVGQVWSLVKTLMPARTVAKVSLFRADRPEEFKAELLQRVDLSQIPDWLGGHATGWAHGEGGSVPTDFKG